MQHPAINLLRSLLITAAFLCALPASAAEIPWYATGWSRRAIVVIPDADGATRDVDVAAVRIEHAGLASADAGDFRVFNSQGKVVPCQIAAHDPKRDTLILFRCDKPKSIFTIYFGKPDARADGFRITIDAKPGSGPPRPGPATQGWVPRAGLVLQTFRRPREPASPNNLAQMTDLFARAVEPDGAGYRTNISDGINPFGNSSYYVSVYRGWIRLDNDGRWGFCTASSKSSFSFLDGKTLVDWPGQHNEGRGRFGEQHAEHQLSRGLHYVEYYQEQTEGSRMSFLGWRPPDAKPDSYFKIPEDAFVQPMWGRVDRYERAAGQPVPTIHPELIDSHWPRGGHSGQYTRYRFDAALSPDAIAKWQLTWDFGDGQSASGPAAEHVFFHLGRFTVSLSATGPAGQKFDLAWPVDLFPMEFTDERFRPNRPVDGFKTARPGDLAKLALRDDRTKYSAPDLADFARLMNDAGNIPLARQAAGEAAARADASPADLLEMQTLATAGLLADGAQADAFARQLRAAIPRATDPPAKILLLARLIPLVGIVQTNPDEADKCFTQAQTIARDAGVQGPTKEALRLASIAIGDVRLLAHHPDAALESYRAAEALAATPISPEVRAAKTGAYPESIQQHLDTGRVAEARELVERWMDQSPSDKTSGAPWFYLGKVLLEQNLPAPAVRPLRAAAELGAGSEFEAEARWRLARAQEQSGDPAAAAATLRALVKSGLNGPWLDKAKAELKAMN